MFQFGNEHFSFILNAQMVYYLYDFMMNFFGNGFDKVFFFILRLLIRMENTLRELTSRSDFL